jgi:colanic acid/amylovoran biosynthesis glycosyltransferase
LKQKGISFEYKIIGEGNHRQALEYVIKESGLENEVKLLGEQDRELVKSELAQAHIFIHPAISEGFSNAVLEAQAMALPIICTDADGLSENITDGETGYIVPKWNEQAIAEKIEMLWSNKSHLTEMGNAGAARVQQHFTIEKQMTAFIAFYHQLSDAVRS